MRTIDMNDPEDRKFVMRQCAATLVCLAAESDEGCLQIEMQGVEQRGIDLGNWVVTVECIPPAGRLN